MEVEDEIKKQLQAIARKIAQDSCHDVVYTQRVLEATTKQYCDKDTPQSGFFPMEFPTLQKFGLENAI